LFLTITYNFLTIFSLSVDIKKNNIKKLCLIHSKKNKIIIYSYKVLRLPLTLKSNGNLPYLTKKWTKK